LADEIGRASPEIATENSGNQEGTAVELWEKVYPQLEKSLGLYDELDSDSLPEKAWLRASKASYQQQIDKILDTVIRVLAISGAAGCRNKIRKLQQAVTESHQHLVIRLRSNSARTPIICHIARPVGISVSIASVRDRNFTPRCFKSSSIVIRLRKLRPNRSSFQTVSVSPCSSFFRQRRRAGRFVVAPDKPSFFEDDFASGLAQGRKLHG